MKNTIVLGFSFIFKGFLASERSKIMKIRENSAKGGKKSFREQGNKANGALQAPNRGPEVPMEEGKRAQKGHGCH